MKYYVIFDINGLLYRYGYGYQNKEDYNNEKNGALFGIFSLLLKIEQDFPIYKIIFCYDKITSSQSNKKIFSDYKGNRKKMPDFLSQQLEKIKTFCKEINLPLYGDGNFEGDDIIFTIVQKITQQKNINKEILVVSIDKDLLQIMEFNNVSLLLINKPWKMFFTKFDVWNYIKIMPKQIPDLLALAGDPSDNIPGIKNVGYKTAIKILKNFGTIENLLEQQHLITPVKLKQNIIQNREYLILFKILTKLKYIDYLSWNEQYYITLDKKNTYSSKWLKYKAGLNEEHVDKLLKIFSRIEVK